MSQHNCKLLHDSVTLIWKCYHEERESMKAKLRQNVVACELICFHHFDKKCRTKIWSGCSRKPEIKATNTKELYLLLQISTCSERPFLTGLGRNICMIWKDSVMNRAFITFAGVLFSAWKGKTCIKWYIYFLKELFNAFFYISRPEFIAFSMYVPCIAMIDYLCHNRFRIKAPHWLIEVLRS